MTTKLTLSIPFIKVRKRSIDIEYKYRPITLRQKRFSGRRQLVPSITLADYRCEAVIDFIEIEVDLARPTQFHYVRKELAGRTKGSFFVKNSDKGAGTTNKFLIRFHDAHLAEVVHATQHLAAHFGINTAPKTYAIEVSLDFYPRSPSEIARKKLVAFLGRHLVTSPEIIVKPRHYPRMAWASGREKPGYMPAWGRYLPDEDSDPVMNTDTDITVAPDATFYFGEQYSPVMWRVMDKYVDRQNHSAGTREVLSEESRRARAEVTLRGSELKRAGIELVSDLPTLSFTHLQSKYFRFMVPTFLEEPTAAECFIERRRRDRFLNIGVAGLLAFDMERSRMRKQIRKGIVAKGIKPIEIERVGDGKTGTLLDYSEMSRKVAVALQKLQLRERRLLK